MTAILGFLDKGAHLSVDVADRAIHDEERLVDVCADPMPGQRRLVDHIELGAHLFAVDLDAADLPQSVDGVGERLRRVPLRDAEVTFGRGVI